MCGRYYVDDETAKEIEKLIRIIDEKQRRESVQDNCRRYLSGQRRPNSGRKGKRCVLQMAALGIPRIPEETADF